MPAVPRRARRFDTAGMLAATVSIGALVYAFIEAPTRGWANPAVVAATVLALAGLVGFVRAERTARTPLLPPGVYTDRGFATSAGQGALFNFTFYGLLFALSLLLQQGRGLDPLRSGLLFLPLTGLISIGSLCAAPLAQRLGRRGVLGLGQVALTVTLLAVAWASTAGGLWPLAVALLPAGFFAGLLVPTMTSQSITAVPPGLHGAASAAFNTSRQVGAAIGVATFGPLLGAGADLGGGFVTCVSIGAAATALMLLLTAVARPAATPARVGAGQ
jgi:DHA2 family methylenomycin A resistance protein-like MFS transporter